MTLSDLTAQEEHLMSRVALVTGQMEEKALQLKLGGVFVAYEQVHKEYVGLAEQAGDLEALKRAIFLQWYAVSEPCCFTGLSELGEDVQKRALELLDQSVRRSQLDDEFRWMLAHYYNVSDYYLDRLEGFEALKEISRTTPGDLWLHAASPRSSLDGRGQMGAYWRSITSSKSAV